MNYLSNVLTKTQAENTYREEYVNENGETEYAYDELYIDNLNELLVEADQELRAELGLDGISIELSDGYSRGDATDEEVELMQSLELCEIEYDEYDEDGEIEYVGFAPLENKLAERYEAKALALIAKAKAALKK